ncbi:hypothetical protein [Paucibacter soli]|uniref:hypothetical protein n=1 Tax=Paucibacter soli TaxID=3133433 RepID=UPI00309FC2C5
MYKHNNSAARIHALLTKAMSQPDKALYQVLADVFDVRGADDAATGQLVLPRLNWFYVELDLLEAQVRSTQISPHLYDGAFARVRMVISPINLAAGWQGMRGNLTPDVLLALAFLSELLPDEETAIPPGELEGIAAEVEALAELVREAALPEALRQLIEHQLLLIRLALDQYPIQGAKAFREAGRTALGEIIEARETSNAPAKDSEELSRLGKLWKRVNTATDAALKIEKVGQLGYRAWEALSAWLQ